MIDERPHRNLSHQLRYSAGVIDVVVRQQYVVDALDASCFCRGGNTLRVPALGIRPTCVDEQGVLVRRNEQRRLPAFHIDEVNLQ